MTPKSPLHIVLLVLDGMDVLDLGGPLQALTTANRCSGNGQRLYNITVVSAKGGLMTTSAGLPIMTVALADLAGAPIDTLIVCGGKDGELRPLPSLVAWVARTAPAVRRLCSVCTGAFLLAAAGQLDGRQVAAHWAWAQRLQARYPSLSVDSEKIFIRDGAVWTSAGGTAAIDLTLALIEQDYGHQVSIDVARQLVMFVVRSSGQSQLSAPLAAQSGDGDAFIALHAWIAGHLADDLCVERLAEQACMAPRTFARMYVESVGCTPIKTVRAMRLEAACRALEETRVPVKSIAARVGLSDEQVMRRAFIRTFGISPTAYRNRFQQQALASAARSDRPAFEAGC